MPTLYLIDGHALAYRAYFALAAVGDRWHTAAGEPTAAVYGFTAKVLEVLEKDRPDYLAVSFDLGRTFRDDLYPEYKGTRAKMPDDLHAQIERIKQVVTALAIPTFTAEGYEADDVLGTVAVQAAQQGVDVVILTGDRDLLQLVTERVRVRLPGRTARDPDTLFTPALVQEKFGVTPAQFVDYKALIGDASDNIPGVKGIGEKTAVRLLQTYGTLEGVYAHLDDLSPGERAKLQAGRDSALLSRALAAIVTTVPLTWRLADCRPGQHQPQAVLDLFQTLEFRGLSKKVLALASSAVGAGAPPATAPAPVTASGQLGLFGAESAPARALNAPATQVTLVRNDAALADLASALGRADTFALDTETTGLDPLTAQVVGMSLAVQAGHAWYIPLLHRGEADQLPLETVLAALRPALTDPAKRKVGHNLKFDWQVLAVQGLRLAPPLADTMLAEWMCNPDTRQLGLKKLAHTRLGVLMTELSELIGTGKKQITFDAVPLAQAAPYAAADADLTLQLWAHQQADLRARAQWELFETLEMPLLPVLAEMELTGIALDAPALRALAVTLRADIARLEADIQSRVGYALNVNSPAQLSDALFGVLGLRPPDKKRKTEGGKFSTAADVLDDLRDQHPIIPLILEHRELSKLLSTYVEALPQAINPRTGRVHTSFNQAGAVTGRLASSEPNLQNIPIRTAQGRLVRRAFVAAPGQVLLSADYSQVELRLAAHMSGDPTLQEAFRRGEDIHATTAAAVMGVPLAEVTADQRRQAKAVNFGLLYGMGAFALSRQTGMTLAEAENFVRAYFERFPGIRRYLEETKQQARALGYVQTLRGRRRYFPQLQSAISADASGQAAMLRARAEREAINAPIQGTAADIIKQAMLDLPPALAAAGLRARLLLQVHDELVLECPLAEITATASLVRQVMSQAATLSVPLAVEVKVGANWDEMTKVAVA